MKDNIFSVFDKVYAEDALKEKTKDYLYAEIRKKKQLGKRRLRLTAACSVFAGFLFCILYFSTMYFLPNAYIDVDINPSVELTLNRFGKVIDLNAYNDDGTKLLLEISVKNKNYDDAMKILMDAMELAGYFKQGGLLSVTVQAKESSRESSILDGLKKSIDTCNEEHHHNAAADIKAVTEEVKEEARQEQLSPAKYLIIQDLLKADTSASIDECRKHSIEELQQSLQEHCSDHENGSYFHGGHHDS